MEQTKQLAIQSVNKQVSFPSQGDWSQIIDIANRAFRSGLLPTSIKNAEGASIVALKAWELGLPPMMAFSHIHIINGKPTLSAELMQSLARKNLPGIQITIVESTDKKAVVRILRPERGSAPYTFSFSIEDAEKAKLLAKDVWKQYPGPMLFSRCISKALRMVCPDALMGVSYTPEELGANVEGDGTVIETTGKPVPQPKEEEKPAPKVEEREDPIISTPALEAAIASVEEGTPKHKNLSDDDLNHLKAIMVDAKKNKQEVMSYCMRNFQKPFLSINHDEFKILCEDLQQQIL